MFARAGALSLVLAFGAGCNASTVITGAAPGASVPTPTPSPSPSPGNATGGSGGTVVIPVPTSAAVVCSPSPVMVAVNQSTVVDCTAAGYTGPLTWSVGDANVAAVTLASGTYTFFTVRGLEAGTTSLDLRNPPDGTGSVEIVVGQ